MSLSDNNESSMINPENENEKEISLQIKVLPI